jgi:hypothetical protein
VILHLFRSQILCESALTERILNNLISEVSYSCYFNKEVQVELGRNPTRGLPCCLIIQLFSGFIFFKHIVFFAPWFHRSGSHVIGEIYHQRQEKDKNDYQNTLVFIHKAF